MQSSALLGGGGKIKVSKSFVQMDRNDLCRPNQIVVMAGLVPAIHDLFGGEERRECPEQVRA
jgi:hypothetical protein